MKKKWRGLLLIGLLFGVVVSQIGIHIEEPSIGTFSIGDQQVTITIGTVAYAAGVADYTCDGVDDNVQFQAAIDALPATGGKIIVLTGSYSFSVTVTRAIDNVTIVGTGQSTVFNYDAATPIFSAGAQSNWVFRDFGTDAGGLNIAGASGWIKENILEGATYVGYQVAGDILPSANSTYNIGSVGNEFANINIGEVTFPEVTTPVAVPNYGKVYNKNDDYFYYQDGAGAEHRFVLATDIFTESYTIPLRGVTDNEVTLTGEIRTVASGEVGSYTTDFPVSNQHVVILMNSITAGGNVIITGTSVNEDTGVPSLADTEIIVVDTTASQRYQTDKKWWEVTNIDTSALNTPNYDVEVIGYNDHNNSIFTIHGYRLDAYAQGVNPDFALIIYKVQDDGGKKMSLITMEYYGVDANGGANQIVDNLRVGGSDRSVNPAVASIWLNDTIITLKVFDFSTYFSSGENFIDGLTKNEGYIIKLVGEPLGAISNVDYVSLKIRYSLGEN